MDAFLTNANPKLFHNRFQIFSLTLLMNFMLYELTNDLFFQLLNQKSSTEESLEALRKSHEEERTSLQTQLIEFDKQLISLKLKVSLSMRFNLVNLNKPSSDTCIVE